VAGETISGRPDIWLLKLDASGTIQWEKTYGGNVSNAANSIHQTYDGGYIVGGTTTSFGGNANYWVLKLDGTGGIGTGCTLIATSHGTVANTGAQAVDSSGTQNTTHAMVAITNVVPKETKATPLNQCSSP
jgi:Tol biopolymer transport system component